MKRPWVQSRWGGLPVGATFPRGKITCTIGISGRLFQINWAATGRQETIPLFSLFHPSFIEVSVIGCRSLVVVTLSPLQAGRLRHHGPIVQVFTKPGHTR